MRILISKQWMPTTCWFVTGLLFMFLTFWTRYMDRNLGRPVILTGWFLFSLLVLLGIFNARKRLSMLPLGKASVWLLLHVIGGVVALPLFWLHTGTFWPNGLYEQILTFLFYFITVTGVLGYLLQRLYPPLLTNSGVEIIYERIPSELADLREEAETIVIACTKETGSPTLARHYTETLDWFFRRPRFILNHIFGGEKGNAWQRRQCATVERYLNDPERKFLGELSTLANYKNILDFHYAVQSVMKIWLLIHIPLAVAIMTLVVWHVVLVHVYAL